MLPYITVILSVIFAISVSRFHYERSKFKSYIIILTTYQTAYLTVANAVYNHVLKYSSESTAELENMIIFLGTELSEILEKYKGILPDSDIDDIVSKLNGYSEENSVSAIVSELIKNSIDRNESE